MAKRIIPLNGDLFVRRRITVYAFGTVAGKLLGERTTMSVVAGRIRAWHAPHFSTVAAHINIQTEHIRTIAGKLYCLATDMGNVAGLIIPCVRATVAGLFSLQYSNTSTVGGRFVCLAERAMTVAGYIYPCVRVAVAGVLTMNTYRVGVVAGLFKPQKNNLATIGGLIMLKAPAWDQSMSGT